MIESGFDDGIDLLEPAQLAQPLVLQDRERWQQNGNRRNQRHRTSEGLKIMPEW